MRKEICFPPSLHLLHLFPVATKSRETIKISAFIRFPFIIHQIHCFLAAFLVASTPPVVTTRKWAFTGSWKKRILELNIKTGDFSIVPRICNDAYWARYRKQFIDAALLEPPALRRLSRTGFPTRRIIKMCLAFLRNLFGWWHSGGKSTNTVASEQAEREVTFVFRMKLWNSAFHVLHARKLFEGDKGWCFSTCRSLYSRRRKRRGRGKGEMTENMAILSTHIFSGDVTGAASPGIQ